MIDVKAVAGGFAIAGSLALASLGMGSGLANAAPAEPQVPSVQGTSQVGSAAAQPSAPSPYAAYGDTSVCANPGLYFVNICS